MSTPAGEHYTLALQGFSEFERGALASFFRLAAQRTPSYVQVDQLDRSDFVIADADHAASLQAVLAEGRTHDTVFIGEHAPQGARAWLPRPISPLRILRELDTLVEQRQSMPGELAAALDGFDAPRAAEGADWDTSAFSSLDMAGEESGDILVVEDSAVARRFLQMRLQRLGYAVHLARDAEEALELIERQPFSLMVLDVVLGPPGSLDGLNICQHVKQDPRFAEHRPKVVIVSGLSGPADRVRGRLAGCDAYLTKPLADAEFVDALRALDPQMGARQAFASA